MSQSLTRTLKASALALGLALAGESQAAFKVIGYFPTWQGDVNTIPYNKLTHINYSFVLPRADGSLAPLDGGGGRLTLLVQKAKAANVKVLISIGGWNNGDDSAFRSLAANATYRANFVNNVMNFINQYGLDGADIDWEYPDAGAEAADFKRLMTDLGNRLRPAGKLLTAAVTANDSPGSIDPGVISVVDFLNLMVYDMGYPHSTYAHAQASLSHWRWNEGLPREKMILGLPFYSHKDWVSYRDVIARYGTWASQVDNAGGLDYNGQPTIRAKTELAKNEAGGVMFWELSQDTRDGTSLLDTIWSVAGSLTQQPTPPPPVTPPPVTPTPGTYPDWRAGQWYPKGSIVRYNGKLYIAEHENPGYDPVISYWFWKEYTPPATPIPPPVAGGPAAGRYEIKVAHSGKCLDINAAGTANGVNVQQYSCNGTGAQLFQLAPDGAGFYRITNANSGKVLDVAGWSRADGGNIHQWSWHGGDNQRFRVVGKGGGQWEIRSKWSDKCVDVAAWSTADRANVQQWTCNDKANQRWILTPR